MRRAGGCCYATYLHVFPLLVMLPFPKRFPSRSQTLCPGRSLLPTFPFLEGVQPAVRRRTSPRPPQSSWAAGSDVGISTGKRAGAAYLASFLAHQEMLPHTLDGRASSRRFSILRWLSPCQKPRGTPALATAGAANSTCRAAITRCWSLL